MKKFELFMCCLGNGVTVCNKAVLEHGDYKQIAHISAAGNIKLYVKESYIPESDMEKIRNTAQTEAEKFRNSFEMLPITEQYYRIVEFIPLSKWHEIREDKRPIAEKLPALREYYYSIM